MFITDRDLLALEPSLFREVGWLGQTIVSANATLTGGVLILSGRTLTGTGVGVGNVATHARTSYEVLGVPQSDRMTVSHLRAEITGPAIVPADAASAPATIVTFEPQIAIVHRQLLRMLGVQPTGTALEPGEIDESRIRNPADLKLVEALGTLHLIFAAAGSPSGEDSPASHRAKAYRERFMQERWRVRARVDVDGDGVADAERSLSVAHLRRV
ncbi:MAG: hypothetical protein K2W85_01335 [Phycisphaerales bacterium]|nr:hypothetical protein [Phycisphaerales bacterium]